MSPNSEVPSFLEAAWMLACEPTARNFCDDGMIPNSLKLFGFDCAAILGSFARMSARFDELICCGYNK